ncbi:hypothetical protein N1851_033723 [Merluccius polli]|uniref:Alkylated DNA repair protein AlkB homologue 8 N-terminal domain-containing protein n=1 Tax=Merluccius polli TaxID=89951 RepID=A0AA47M0U5_MERPO|nr:hypothetical protein N1851_033723 [Merluccius polli]
MILFFHLLEVVFDWMMITRPGQTSLQLLKGKTKELIVDFRKEKRETHNPIHINGMAVERVSSFKFLGTHISENLTWAINTSSLVKKANQRLFFLRTLKKNHLSADILCNFYRCAIESILTNCITAWYGNCSVADRKSLQRVVKTAQRVTGTPLQAIEVVRKKQCLNRARSILKDPSHPANRLFQLLPSRRRFRSLQTKTSSISTEDPKLSTVLPAYLEAAQCDHTPPPIGSACVPWAYVTLELRLAELRPSLRFLSDSSVVVTFLNLLTDAVEGNVRRCITYLSSMDPELLALEVGEILQGDKWPYTSEHLNADGEQLLWSQVQISLDQQPSRISGRSRSRTSPQNIVRTEI